MSVQVWLALALLILGAVVGAVGTAALGRANPTETIPYSGNQGWKRYRVTYFFEVVAIVGGVILLQGEAPLWVAAIALLVAVAPQIVLGVVHQRQVRRHRASTRGGRQR